MTHFRNLQLAMLLCMQKILAEGHFRFESPITCSTGKKCVDFRTNYELKVVFPHERPCLINT